MFSKPNPTADELHELVARNDQATADIGAALRDAEASRQALIISGGSDAEIDAADAEMARLQRGIERSVALAEAARTELPAAEAAERARIEADDREVAAGYAADYERRAREEYLPAAETLAGILAELQLGAVEFATANARLASARRLPPLETFRGGPVGGLTVPTIFDNAKLPAVDYADHPAWDTVDAARRHQLANEQARREREAARELAIFAARKPIESRPPIVHDGRIDAAGMRYNRPNETAWFKEREERIAAEEAAMRANSSDQSKRTGGAH